MDKKPLTPAQRVLRAQAAADASWANTRDRAARTEPARRAALARFEQQVDPAGVLPPDERALRAASARRAHFRLLALRSARARGHRSASHSTTEEGQGMTSSAARLTVARAFWVDDAYDREYASDGVSRYGAYLRQRAHLFRSEGVPTSDPVVFALVAWEIASPLTMWPGYVRWCSRVRSVFRHRDEDSRYALAAEIAVVPPAVFPARIGGDRWCGWSTDGDWREPEDNDEPAVYTTLTVRVPVRTDQLPDPAYRRSIPDLVTAQLAVRCLTSRLSSSLVDILAVLD